MCDVAHPKQCPGLEQRENRRKGGEDARGSRGLSGPSLWKVVRTVGGVRDHYFSMAPGGRGRVGVWQVEQSGVKGYSRAAAVAVEEGAPEFARAEC